MQCEFVYGRDSFGVRASSPFSEGDWKAWLAEVAANYRNGLDQYATKNLGDTVAQPDLSATDVYRRLSDIIDGKFVKTLPSGKFTLSDVAVSHSLGAGLLFMLQDAAPATQSEAENLLSDWLDPISGLDADSKVAVEILDNLLFETPSGEIDPGGEVFVDTQTRRKDPGSFSFRPPPLFPDDPFGGLREISNPDEADEHRRVWSSRQVSHCVSTTIGKQNIRLKFRC